MGGIPLQVTTAEFIDYFAGFGKVRSFLLPPDPHNKKSNCGYGFVNYRDSETLKKVIAQPKHVMRAKEVGSTAGRPGGQAAQLEEPQRAGVL